jgi:phospholipase C
MMENRPFDHMLGSLNATDPRIDRLDGSQTNPDTDGNQVTVTPDAKFRASSRRDHAFIAVDQQIFNGDPNRVANMKGFVRSYWDQLQDVPHSHNVMQNLAHAASCERAARNMAPSSSTSNGAPNKRSPILRRSSAPQAR